MPIMKAGRPRKIPKWADFSDWGISVMKPGQTVEKHYHDGVEFVVIISGKIRVITEGKGTILGPGDTVITKIGNEHSWQAIKKTVSIWVVSKLKGRKRPGHLHRK